MNPFIKEKNLVIDTPVAVSDTLTPGSDTGSLFSALSLIFMKDSGITWILHESEAFICKALKAEAIPLIAGCLGLNNAADGSLRLAALSSG